MPSHPPSLAQIATELLVAPDVDAALAIVNGALATDRYVGIALLAYDGRRSTVTDRRMDRAITPVEGASSQSGVDRPPQIALDHLPATVRSALLSGQQFADVGEQSLQYAKLLGIHPPTDDVRLFLKGIVLDGALTAVIGIYDGRSRSAGKLLERVEPIAALLEATYARLFERSARFEAVSALHEITSRLRSEHATAIAELQREVSRLRTSRGDVIDQKRAADLAAAAESATRRAVAAEKRLAAVEQQVSSAVARLEEAHLQIYRQAEELRVQSETIRRLEEALPQL